MKKGTFDIACLVGILKFIQANYSEEPIKLNVILDRKKRLAECLRPA